MPSVGAVSVPYLSGRPTAVTQRVEVFHNPGQSGTGAQLMGQNQSRFTFRAFFYGALSTVESTLTSLYAVQGTVVTITNDHGNAYTNCLVTSVGPAEQFQVDHEGSSKVACRVALSGVVTGT